jgi:hypothetical protein
VLDDSDPSDVVTSALFWTQLREVIRNSKARDKIVILDCCHAGAAVDDDLGGAFRGEIHIERIGDDARGSTASILVACGPDGFARESEKLGGGMLTNLILDALGPRRREAADGTGAVSLASLQSWMWRRIDDAEDYAAIRREKPRLFAFGAPIYYLDLPEHLHVGGPIGPELESASVVSALSGADGAACDGAIDALAQSGPAAAAAVPAVSRLLSHWNRSVRTAAVAALGNCGAAATSALVGALSDPDDEVRGRAVEALQRIGPGGLPQLAAALSAEDEHVQLGAAAVLARIGQAAAEATPQLLHASVSGVHAAVRQAAAEALDQVGPAAAPKLVSFALNDRSSPTTQRAVDRGIA